MDDGLNALDELIEAAERYQAYHDEKFYADADVKPTGLRSAIAKARAAQSAVAACTYPKCDSRLGEQCRPECDPAIQQRALVSHDWQPDGGVLRFESHPGGEVAHVHTTCTKCGTRAWFLEYQWELLAKGCSTGVRSEAASRTAGIEEAARLLGNQSMSVDELQLTLDAIDAAWLDAYGAAGKSATPTAARNRVTLLAKDVKCGADNFRVANAAYVKADAELRALQSAIEEAEARCCPEDFGFEEWIGVLKKRDNVVAHTHLQEIVSLLLQTMVPIGPMRDRTDYPVELQRAIDFLHGRVAQSAVARSEADVRSALNEACGAWSEVRKPLGADHPGEADCKLVSIAAEKEAVCWQMIEQLFDALGARSANAPLRLMSQCARHQGLPITVTSMAHAAVFYCPHCEEEGRKQAQP